ALDIIRRRKDNHGPRSRQNTLRLDALLRSAFQPCHLAVLALTKPTLELIGVMGRSRSCEAAIVEAEFERALANSLLQCATGAVRATRN
ncbi:MAG TPA: hypothetical protein VNT99_20220, partial [Methylomirabilota bacterium]|nr:hypothetical protein [Methylomirabilota bacterium]